MKTVHKPSVIPIYGIGAVWLLFCVAGSLHTIWQLLLCAAVSAAVFFVLRFFCPGTDEQVAQPEPEPDTGSAEVDAALRSGRESLRELHARNENITDPEMSRQLDELERLTKEIFAHLQQHPEKFSMLQTFLDYYLPTTLRLLRSYDELQRQSVRGENINTAMERIEQTLGTVVTAFSRQADALYASETVDITAEVAVLERMMAANGLREQD